jgi:hypothetical protein
MSIPSKPDQQQVRTRENKRSGFAFTIFFTGVLGTMLITILFPQYDNIILSGNNSTPQKQEILHYELFPSWLAWLYYS